MLDTFKSEQPELEFINKEEEKLFYSFCTFTTLRKNETKNYVTIFLDLLKNKYERKLFKDFFSIDTDYEAIQVFLKYAPQITKSKYITKHLNKGKIFDK